MCLTCALRAQLDSCQIPGYPHANGHDRARRRQKLVGRFDLGRKVFLSGDRKEEQLPETKTPHVPADRLRLTAYGLRPLTDAAPETLRSRWP